MALVTKTTMATVAKAASPLSGDCYGLESKITSANCLLLPVASRTSGHKRDKGHPVIAQPKCLCHCCCYHRLLAKLNKQGKFPNAKKTIGNQNHSIQQILKANGS